MIVLELRAENFKRLKAVTIRPDADDSLVIVSGANAQGKSSVLDAIWAALAGPKGYSVAEPVRQGEEDAEVRVDLGELIVTRRWTASTGRSTLKVETPSGMSPSGAQGVLDKLLGRLSFDPLAFANAKPAEQRATLLELAGLDLEGFSQRRKMAFEQRTETNREAKRARAALSQLPVVDSSTPDAPVNSHDVSTELMKVKELDAAIERLQAEHGRLKVEMDRVMEQGREATRQRALITRTPEELSGMLAQTDKINAAVQVKLQRGALQAQAASQEEASADLTKRIEAVDREQQQAVEAASMPAPGLGFTDDGVTLNGVAFSQASAAERLKTSLAIAMAMNPEIRVIRITDGSLLDKANLALIEQMATDAGWQVWVERVDDSGSVGVVIEDGEVKS